MSAPEGALRRVRVRIHGRVQGVFFRASTRERALALGIRGWAQNRPDGSVEVLAEGSRGAVDALLESLRRGPERARVDRVECSEEPARGDLDGFGVG